MRAVVAGIAILASACASTAHVTLPPRPAKDAPLAEREAYRDRVAGAANERGFVIGKDVVEDPSDLLPAVEPGSTTAKAAGAAAFDDGLGTAGIVAAGVGVVGGLDGIILGVIVVNADGRNPDASTAVVIGGSVFMLAGLGVFALASIPAGHVDDERRAAFVAYNDDVAAAVGLPPPAPAPAPAPEIARAPPPRAPPGEDAADTNRAARDVDDAADGADGDALGTGSTRAVAADPLPMHIIARVGGTVVADLDAGPDGALAPRSVDGAHREEAGVLGAVLGTRGSALFACFARTFPNAGAKQRARVKLRVAKGRVAGAKGRGAGAACAAHALSRGGGLGGPSFDVDLDIEHTAGPFVAPRCRRAIDAGALGANAAGVTACLGLFLAPDGVEVTRAADPSFAGPMLAEAFREDGCAAKAARGFALCKRKRVAGVDGATLAAELAAMEERYVRTLTDDDAIVAAALAALR